MLYEFAHENLGYSKKYLRKIVYGERKPYYEMVDGKPNMLWANIQEDLLSDQHKQTWKTIESTFKEMQSHANLVTQIQKDFQRMDWDSLEKLYGEEKVNEMRHNYNNYLENDLPDINIPEVEQQFKTIFNPVFDKMKDLFFDSLPDIEKRFKQKQLHYTINET